MDRGKRMNIPDKIRISGHDILVEQKEYVLDGNQEACSGMAYLLQDRIEVALKWNGVQVSEDARGEAFIHEAIHHIDDKYYIGLKENQVKKLGSGIYAFLRDNLLK
jgi:hypothetical protein